MNSIKLKRYKSCFFYLVCFSILIIYYYIWKKNNYLFNADEAIIVRMARDIIHGNIFLSGFYISTSPLYLTILLSSIVGLFVGFGEENIYFTAALNYSILLFSCWYIIGKTTKNKKHDFNYVTSLLIFFILVNAPNWLNQMVLHNAIHIIAYSLILWSFYFIYTKKYIISFIILFFAAVDDSITFYVAIIPLCFFWIIQIFINEKTEKKNIYNLIFTIMVFFLSRLFLYIMALLGGFKVPWNQDAYFFEVSTMFDKLALSMKHLMYCFGADISTFKIISLETFSKIPNLILFILAVIVIIYNLINLKKLSVLDSTMSISCICLFFMYSFSSISSNDISLSRYLIFIIILSVALLVRKSIELKQKNNKIYNAIIINFFLLFLINIQPINNYPIQSNLDEVSNYLISENLNKGYSDFWSASPITITSNYFVEVAAIADNGDPLLWLTKEQWYDNKIDFILFTKENAFGLTIEKIETRFGQPEKIEYINEFIIMEYKK